MLVPHLSTSARKAHITPLSLSPPRRPLPYVLSSAIGPALGLILRGCPAPPSFPESHELLLPTWLRGYAAFVPLLLIARELCRPSPTPPTSFSVARPRLRKPCEVLHTSVKMPCEFQFPCSSQSRSANVMRQARPGQAGHASRLATEAARVGHLSSKASCVTPQDEAFPQFRRCRLWSMRSFLLSIMAAPSRSSSLALFPQKAS